MFQLSKYEVLNNFERQTNVPKVYVVLGLGVLYFFLVFFNIAAEFLVNTIGFTIPAYYSLHALFTAGSADDTQVSLSDDAKAGMWELPALTTLQWLTYWVVYAFLTVLESTINAVYWFRTCTFFPPRQDRLLTFLSSVLLHLQVHRHSLDGTSSDQVSPSAALTP